MLTRILKDSGPAAVVPYDLHREVCLVLDLSDSSHDLKDIDISNTRKLSSYIEEKLAASGMQVAVGGYEEDRGIYRRSTLFGDQEPRSLHLGIDIWIPSGTAVLAAHDGIIHSFQDNEAFGDYGPTIILEHVTQGVTWHTLYGHLSRASLAGITEGMPVSKSEKIAEVGAEEENGQWPSHLHFQVIADLEGKRGDYPGVCRVQDKEKYLENCPDPQLLLQVRSLNQV